MMDCMTNEQAKDICLWTLLYFSTTVFCVVCNAPAVPAVATAIFAVILIHFSLKKICENRLPLWVAGAAVTLLMLAGGIVWALTLR